MFANSTALCALILCLCGTSHVIANGAAPWVGETFESAPCWGKPQGFGPFDYTKRYAIPDKLKIVEQYHFNSNVERLVSGVNGPNPLTDIDYTLRAWPNHHRALNSVIRFRVRHGKPYRLAEISPAECYLQRAVHFAPEDGTSHMLYGILLDKLDHNEKALEEYKRAESLDANNPNLLYNLGLLLFEMKDYEQSREYAEKAYAADFPLQGLRNKLADVGQWNSE